MLAKCQDKAGTKKAGVCVCSRAIVHTCKHSACRINEQLDLMSKRMLVMTTTFLTRLAPDWKGIEETPLRS